MHEYILFLLFTCWTF